MIFYWSLFAIPAFISFAEKISIRRRGFQPLIFFLIPLIFIMAFRQTGGDYYTYNLMLVRFGGFSLIEWMEVTEPIYGFFNWASYSLGWGLYGVNAACAVVFAYCLYKFAIDEPKPILLLSLAMPYLIIVTAIGYTRQGMAVGFFMLGLTFLRRYQPVRYIVCSLLAMGFHSSAVLLLPLVYFGISNKGQEFMRYAKAAAIFTGLVVISLSFSEKIQGYSQFYIESTRYQSGGAFQRSIQSGLAGIIFFLFNSKWDHYFQDRRYMVVIAIGAIAAVPASLYFSTAIDRLGLYLLPFQILVFSRFPLFQKGKKSQGIATLGVILAYALSLYVWLHHGSFAKVLWVPFDHLFIGAIE